MNSLVTRLSIKIILVIATLFFLSPTCFASTTQISHTKSHAKATTKTHHKTHKRHSKKHIKTKKLHHHVQQDADANDIDIIDSETNETETNNTNKQSERVAKNLSVPKLNVPAYFYKNKEPEGTPPSKFSLSAFLMPEPSPSTSRRLVSSVEQHLVAFVRNTVTTLRYSDYKLGGKKFDLEKGVYVVDCSNFVDHILQHVSPHAYSSLVNSSGSPTPATQHYYEFFTELTEDSNHYWNKVSDVNSLRAGDILVFRSKSSHGSGHVMVVMDKPIRDTNVFYVRVADSAPSRHSQDTRNINEAGIGIGTLLLKVNPQTGKPSAYAWGIGSYWKKNVKFAMARPLDVV